MSEGDYEIGYGKPPKANQFKKLQSGNPEGRRQKPPPTVAGIVENALLDPLHVTIGDVQKQSTGFELITLGLLVKISDGVRKALRVLRKYEAFAKTKPRIRRRDLSGGGDTYRHFLETGKWEPKRFKKKRTQMTPEERGRHTLNAKIERMKAGLDEIEILPDMSARDASELYQLFLQQPSRPNRPRQRHRKGRLEASEIYDQVINAPVTVNNEGELMTAPRIELVVKRLLAKAVRGDIKSADMLITMHADSIKHGDFFPETKYLKG